MKRKRGKKMREFGIGDVSMDVASRPRECGAAAKTPSLPLIVARKVLDKYL